MVFGWLGWFVGDFAGWGFFASFVLSSVGSLVGVYVGWKVAQRFG
jgi:hypothetical protein